MSDFYANDREETRTMRDEQETPSDPPQQPDRDFRPTYYEEGGEDDGDPGPVEPPPETS